MMKFLSRFSKIFTPINTGKEVMTEDELKDKYLEKVFTINRSDEDKGKNKNDNKAKNKIDDKDKEKIEDALNRAHEIRKFEIGLYWQRSLFFWGFIVAFFASYFAVLSSDTEIDHVYLILIAISLLGVFTSFAWLHIEIGARSWQKNWEYHIDFLEYALEENLTKTIIGTPKEFRSLASIHKCFIKVIFIFWTILFGNSLYIYLKAYNSPNTWKFIEKICPDAQLSNECIALVGTLILLILAIVFCFFATNRKICFCFMKFSWSKRIKLLGWWLTSETTFPYKEINFKDLIVAKRNLGEGIKFQDKSDQ